MAGGKNGTFTEEIFFTYNQLQSLQATITSTVQIAYFLILLM